MHVVSVCLLSIGLFYTPVRCSEDFRGGLISWEPGLNKDEIVVDYRVSWGKDTVNHVCNESMIEKGSLISGDANLLCFDNCQGIIGPLHYRCTDFSNVENWISGRGRTTATISLNSNISDFEFEIAGGTYVGGGGTWRLKAKGNLRVRQDIDRINTSPKAEIFPIVRLKHGCTQSIKIPVIDPDNDDVRCRWASKDLDECGSICNGLQNASISQDCAVTFNAMNPSGWYAIAIQIEDFASAADTTPLSSVPVQFLVEIYHSNDSCSSKTDLVGPSPNDGYCANVVNGETFKATLMAQVTDSHRSIAEIMTISPEQMVKSPLKKINSTTWQVDLSWTPGSISERTSNVLCYAAIDTLGDQSERRCITVPYEEDKESMSCRTYLDDGVSEYSRRAAAVQVRLVDGTDQNSGRVELFHAGAWGTVCDDDFDDHEADVICRMLGKISNNSFSTAYQGRHFPSGNGSILLDDLRCFGNESSISDCGSRGWMTHGCSHSEDAGVSCLNPVAQLRLVNGSDSHSGRVEVYHNGEWGIICDNSFDTPDAIVICKQLGYTTDRVKYWKYSNYGDGQGRTALYSLSCTGNERIVNKCQHSAWFTSSCSLGHHAGVDCNVRRDAVRFVNGTSVESGRVEVYHNGKWGTICSNYFDIKDARVICKQMGYYANDSNIRIFTKAFYGEGHGDIAMGQLQCSGSETDISLCHFRRWLSTYCGSNKDVGIECNDSPSNHPLRLVNGSNSHSGRLEIYSNGQWSAICDTGFDTNDAVVACRQLGMYTNNSLITIYPGTNFGEGTSTPVLSYLACNSREQYIADCLPRRIWNSYSCARTRIVGIDCNDSPSNHPLRLVNGSNSHSGRLEMYSNGQWSTICDTGFDINDAVVACRQLGMYTSNSRIRIYEDASFGEGSDMPTMYNPHCNGREQYITDCLSRTWNFRTCAKNRNVGIDCNDAHPDYPVRLVNGSNQYSGRIEMYVNGQWGSVCSFNKNDATVVCKQLGMYTNDSKVGLYLNEPFGKGNGLIHLKSISCNGHETNISQCSRKIWTSNECSPTGNVGIDCDDNASAHQVRLVDGPNKYAGRVEVFTNGEWGTVCDDSFDIRDARVICRQLGMYHGDSKLKAYSSAHFGQGQGKIALDNLNCRGTEQYIFECGSPVWFYHNCGHGEDAGVECNVLGAADTIQVGCDESGWSINVNLTMLKQVQPGSVASNIYLGENSCQGVENSTTLSFRQGIDECLTSRIIQANKMVYRNQLVYAEHDPRHPFLIRHYNWTVDVECDVSRNESSTGQIYHSNGTNNTETVLGTSHYKINMTFFSDPNFLHQIQGNPVHVAVGSKVYVKVFSTSPDWTVKMRVHTCYTKPSASASASLRYEIIKNGCEMDTGTHIISQTAHETRFVFEDFEYTSNHQGLYVVCDAIFCATSNTSQQCTQTCNP